MGQRDEYGWLISRPGTKMRGIYDLLLEGKSPSQISQAFPELAPEAIKFRIWRIKHPDTWNAKVSAAKIMKTRNTDLKSARDTSI